MSVPDPVSYHARKLARVLARKRAEKLEDKFFNRIQEVTAETDTDRTEPDGTKTSVRERISIKRIAEELWDNILVKFLYLLLAIGLGILLDHLHAPHWLKELMRP